MEASTQISAQNGTANSTSDRPKMLNRDSMMARFYRIRRERTLGANFFPANRATPKESAAITAGVAPQRPTDRRTDDAADIAEGLIAAGNFSQAFGLLPGDTILAFTANGEAHWFRLRIV